MDIQSKDEVLFKPYSNDNLWLKTAREHCGFSILGPEPLAVMWRCNVVFVWSWFVWLVIHLKSRLVLDLYSHSAELVASWSFSCASNPIFIALVMFWGSVASFIACAAADDEAFFALAIKDWMRSLFSLMNGAKTLSYTTLDPLNWGRRSQTKRPNLIQDQ